MKGQKVRRMSSLTQKKLRGFLMGVLLFAVPLVAIVAINIHPSVFLADEEVSEMQREMAGAALRFQNDDGLFIETSIDNVYRAVTVAPLVQAIGDPLVQDVQGVVNYIWARQTPGEGGFSDVALLGNMEDTYKVVETIASLNASFLNRTNEYYRYVNQKIYITNENKTGWLLDFLNGSYVPEAGGFSAKAKAGQPDMVSTWQALELLDRYDQPWIAAHEAAIYNYTASMLVTAGSLAYRFSDGGLVPDARSTYAGLRVRALINRPINGTEAPLFRAFFDSLQNPGSGGYSSSSLDLANLQGTYYCLAGLDALGYPSQDPGGCDSFISSCANPDGGFGAVPASNSSDFASGWEAFHSWNITGYNFSVETPGYRAWLVDRRSLNSLFGSVTLPAIHDGLRSLVSAGQDLQATLVTLSEHGIDASLISPSNIIAFVGQCYNDDDGGYGLDPHLGSSLKGTYLAVDILRMLESTEASGNVTRLEKNVDYVLDRQMDDGGFKIGDDLGSVLGMFSGGAIELYEGILNNTINENLSAVETSYWAILAMRGVRALNLNVDFEGLTTYNRSALVLWVKSLQNADGGFSSVLAFKSEIVGTYHALELLDVLGAGPHSVVSAVEFIRQAQTDAGGFFLAPFFAEYLGGVAMFAFTYYGATSLHDQAYAPDSWLMMLLWTGLCLDTINHGFGDIPLFGSDLRNIPLGIELLGWITRVQTFDPAPWTAMLVVVILLLAVILVARGLGQGFEKLGLLLVRSSRSRSIEKIVYGSAVPAIQVSSLSISAGGKRIVEKVSLTIEQGEILGVLGESGAGKSTFVKALLGMRSFTGTNLMYGVNVRRSSRRLRPLYGYVPQDLSKVYLNFTVMENLVYFGEQYGLFEKEIVKRGEKLLRNLGIADKADEQVKNLSGGQKRRVSIAIALIHDPTLCILDEPTSGLDPVVREGLWLRLVELNEQFGTTFIVITHYPEESRYCDKVAIFGRKRGMVDYGNPAALLRLLPGGGRAIALQFSGKQENALPALRALEGIDSVLEKKDGEHFIAFSDEGMGRVKEQIVDKFGKDAVKALMQVDVEMEDYFRYKSLEAVIDK
ncbi:MAG: ATP-binding cassette domain-containing protein [Candidatus Lokiarchaeota archaeon]|nr:ATP-binding cassette domain-containing protein [Candidatus Lokiarchaeota archaeon]